MLLFLSCIWLCTRMHLWSGGVRRARVGWRGGGLGQSRGENPGKQARFVRKAVRQPWRTGAGGDTLRRTPSRQQVHSCAKHLWPNRPVGGRVQPAPFVGYQTEGVRKAGGKFVYGARGVS